jgi:hypothetical protein
MFIPTTQHLTVSLHSLFRIALPQFRRSILSLLIPNIPRQVVGKFDAHSIQKDDVIIFSSLLEFEFISIIFLCEILSSVSGRRKGNAYINTSPPLPKNVYPIDRIVVKPSLSLLCHSNSTEFVNIFIPQPQALFSLIRFSF